MDKKIAVVTCSNACLDYIDHPYDVRVFRSALHLGDEQFLDFVDISADEFYQRLEDDSTVFPSSSYMPLGQMIEIYEELKEEGYTHVIVITISKKMSGIFNASLMAANEVEGLEVKVFDSKTVTYPQALMVLKACEMVEQGYELEEIFEELKYIRDNNKIYFAVNTLTYLVKNGRLGNASGFIGNALRIKPVLTIEDGQVETVEKIRTFGKAVQHVLDLYFEETKGKDVVPYIIHANNYETRDFMVEKLKEHDPSLEDVVSVPLTAVVGAHSGPKTIGIGYYIKK